MYLVLGNRLEDVGELVDERVLVANDVPGRPVGAEIRMVGLGDQDVAPALLRFRQPVITFSPASVEESSI